MRQPASLRLRLLAATAVVLPAFVALTGLGLDQAFREAARTAQQDKMQGLVYSLLGAADEVAGSLTIKEADLPDRDLARPGSRRAAFITNAAGEVVWASDSHSGPSPQLPSPAVGQWHFAHDSEGGRFLLAFGIRWLDQGTDGPAYTIAVRSDAAAYNAQLAAFRRTLGFWLAGATGLLLVMQLLAMWWGTTPVRRLAADIRTVGNGQRCELRGAYPQELQPLTRALDDMIRAEHDRLARQRAALSDLAHSLKTPLAVLRGVTDAPPSDWHQRVADQLATMETIVNRQLSRASTTGHRTLASPVAVAPLADRVARAVEKVYVDRHPRIDVTVPDQLRARIDPSDLYELLGNLIDNALKHGGQQVRVHGTSDNDTLCLEVGDDGPGFAEPHASLAERGVRGDETVPGQGIGLAACRDIVQSLDGDLALGYSEALGGARVTIRLPGVVSRAPT
jgi:two-component system sensor histidine kinase PhoQ